MNVTDLPYCSPLKGYKNGVATPHFDGDFTVSRIHSFERNVQYFQKWQRTDTTLLQITSSIAPTALQIYSPAGAVVKTITWTNVGIASVGINIWECTFDIHDLPDGIYYPYAYGVMGGNSFKYVFEPVHLKDTHSETMLFTYWNSKNVMGAFFSTNLKYSFRCEAAILEADFFDESSDFVNESHDTKLLSGIPYRQYKLFIAKAPGVSPYIVDILNRMMCCDHWEIEGLQYAKVSGSKWDISRAKGYPLIGASRDITEAVNVDTNQIATGLITPGFVTGYNIETNFFGGPELNNQVDITEITNS